jgi:hypothetical protein
VPSSSHLMEATDAADLADRVRRLRAQRQQAQAQAASTSSTPATTGAPQITTTISTPAPQTQTQTQTSPTATPAVTTSPATTTAADKNAEPRIVLAIDYGTTFTGECELARLDGTVTILIPLQVRPTPEPQVAMCWTSTTFMLLLAGMGKKK